MEFLNGIDSLIIATGNDFRAIEAGAHAYASREGRYTSLTKYYKNNDGDLVGEIEIPMAIGIVGGAGNIHPKAKFCKKLLGIQSEAYKRAQEIKGKADAEATAIYADAYNRDPEFYQFMKTLEVYRTIMDKETWLLLSTDSEFLKYLKSTGR